MPDIPPNPFPDFPVADLSVNADSGASPTVVTPSIGEARRMADDYLSSASEVNDRRSFIVSVKGDYGTGKTHLLRYVATTLRETAGEKAGIVASPFLESDPLTWYKSSLGPALARLPLQEVMLDLYAMAAQGVAQRAGLTRGAVDRLSTDPNLAVDLVNRELLSASDVDLAFRDLLEDISGAGGETVPRVLSMLLEEDSNAALAWISGEEISGEDRSRLGLPGQISHDRTTADLLVSIASIYKHLRRPFAVLLDELEQFTRYDAAHQTRQNITWVKRVLERLARADALVLVAGHTAAWNVERDYLDRFSQELVLDVPRLFVNEIEKFVFAFTGRSGLFSRENAESVALLSAGNIRRTLNLLHSLYAVSDGFSREISADAIAKAGGALSARIEPEQALALITEELGRLNLSTRRDYEISAGLRFDITALSGDVPVAVLDLKHAVFHRGQYEQLRRFIERVRAARRHSSQIAVACFLVDGLVDERLNELVSAADAPIAIFNSTDPGCPEQIRNEVLRHLGTANSGGKVSPEVSEETVRRDDKSMAELVAEINMVKAAQADFADQVQERLERQGVGGDVITNITNIAGSGNSLESIYREATKRVYLPQLLAVAFGGIRAVSAAVLVVIGVIGLFVGSPLSYSLASLGGNGYVSSSVINGWLAGFMAVSIACLCAGVLLAVREFFATVQYYRLRDSVLYSLYVREVPVRELANTSLIFDNSIQEFGPVRGRRFVMDSLRGKGLLTEIAIIGGRNERKSH